MVEQQTPAQPFCDENNTTIINTRNDHNHKNDHNDHNNGVSIEPLSTRKQLSTMTTMNDTCMPPSGDDKHDDGTMTSRTADGDTITSCDHPSSIASNGRCNPTGYEMRLSLATNPSTFLETISATSTDFSTRSDAHTQHSDGGQSRQFVTDRLSSSRYSVLNSGADRLPVLATETNRMRTSRKLAEISQASLDFSRVTLIGRDKEQRALDHAFQQILKKPTLAVSAFSSLNKGGAHHRGRTHKRNSVNRNTGEADSSGSCIDQHSETHKTSIRSLVSISGYSGTGKSALAATLRPKCMANNVFFVSGKFDLKQMDEPYSGFRTAMTNLCSQICSLPRADADANATGGVLIPERRDSRSFDVIRQRIVQGLNIDELRSLHNLIPNLVDVIGKDTLCDTGIPGNDSDASTVVSASHRAHANTEGFKERSIRLKFAFRRFITVICTYCPLVWVSDDVQWADKESLNMIESCLLDTTISSLMIVICFRSNLVSTDGIDGSRVDSGNIHISDLNSVTTSSTTSLVGDMLVSIQKKRRERLLRYTNLEVNNLLLDNVHVMLKQLLGIYNDDDHSDGEYGGNRNDSSYGLAEIVFKKTDGNVFFVQQFIRMLVKDKLLAYSIASTKWVWDNDQIKQKTPATINVAELMELKLQQIDTAQYLLPLAACLGSTFSWLLLRTVLEGFTEDDETSEVGHRALYESLFGGPPPSSEAEWLDILETYEGEGLIESHADSGSSSSSGSTDESAPPAASPTPASAASAYSFIHDKVQEAALGMISSKMHLLELQHRIGLMLMHRLSPDDFESSLFVVANLLNARLDMIPQYPSSSPTTPKANAIDVIDVIDVAQTVRFRIAKLNLDAGTVAASHSAFRAAFKYFQNAIDMMPHNHWKSHYDMSLQLFTSATECAYASNKYEMMQKYGRVVIERENCPLIDKMRVYHVLMDGEVAMLQRTKQSDVMKLGTEVMAQLGYRYPKNNIMRLLIVVRGMLKLKASTKKWTIEYLDSMQPIEDPMDEFILKTMDKYGWAASICDRDLHPLITIDGINDALTRGRCNGTPVALASLAMVVGPILGDWDSARLYTDYALKMHLTMNDKASETRTTLISYGMVLNNLIPYESCKQPMLDVYSGGMAAGDVYAAMWIIVFYLDLCFLTAKPLESLDADFSSWKKVCEDFHQHKISEQLSTRWQMVLTLREQSDGQVVLVGDAYDEIAAMQRIEETNDEPLKVDMLRTKLFAAVYIGDYYGAAETALGNYDVQLKGLPSYITTMPIIFLSSFSATITCHEDAHLTRSKRNKIKRFAQRSRKALQAAVDRGNPNAVHYLAILTAERAAWKAHTKRRQGDAFQAATKLYQDAILLCARTGFPQNQALANERLAEHMLLEHDTEGAGYHLDEAIRLYAEWGAGRVKSLQERREHIRAPATEMRGPNKA